MTRSSLKNEEKKYLSCGTVLPTQVQFGRLQSPASAADLSYLHGRQGNPNLAHGPNLAPPSLAHSVPPPSRRQGPTPTRRRSPRTLFPLVDLSGLTDRRRFCRAVRFATTTTTRPTLHFGFFARNVDKAAAAVVAAPAGVQYSTVRSMTDRVGIKPTDCQRRPHRCRAALRPLAPFPAARC